MGQEQIGGALNFQDTHDQCGPVFDAVVRSDVDEVCRLLEDNVRDMDLTEVVYPPSPVNDLHSHTHTNNKSTLQLGNSRCVPILLQSAWVRFAHQANTNLRASSFTVAGGIHARRRLSQVVQVKQYLVMIACPCIS